MFGNEAPTLQKLAIKVLSQTASASACERNWSTFALVHTKQRNRLAYSTLQKLVFCSYNMKLQLRDREAELSPAPFEDPLILVEQSIGRMGVDDDDIFVDWIRPVHLDDNAGNPDPAVEAMARERGIDVDSVMRDEVGSNVGGSTTAPTTSVAGGGGNTGASGSGGAQQNAPTMDRSYASFDDQDAYRPSIDEDAWRQQQYYGDLPQQYPPGARQSGPSDCGSMAYSCDDMSLTFGSLGLDDSEFNNRYRDPSHGRQTLQYGDNMSEVDSSSSASQYVPWPVIPHPSFPVIGSTLTRSQQTYDAYLSTFLCQYSTYMSWYDFCMMIDDQSNTQPYEPPRHSFWQ